MIEASGGRRVGKQSTGRVVAVIMRIDIWSDVVCPWCYVGKRRFERALAGFAHRDEVDVRWHSFELDPGAVNAPGSHVQHLADKFGTDTASAQRMLDSMTETAAAEGLDFHFETVHNSNTFDAHRLLHLADARGVQAELKERLMQAHFTEGAAVGSPATLQRLAVEVGLDADEVASVLATDAYAEDVRADVAQAREYGISGVPFFVIDARYGVSGAQPAEALASALEQAWAERATA